MTSPLTTTPQPPFDRLVAKETALGTIRDVPPNRQHIGLQLAPFKEVQSDDVIFDYIEDGLTEGLAPARAQDAESELAQKDDTGLTLGRARLIDWSLKNTYDATKVMSYRDNLRIQQALMGQNALALQTGVFNAPITEFQDMIARDDLWRKSRLDNRLESLIITSFETSKYAYNDGKIAFGVDFKRPANQQDVPAPNGNWDDVDADPIDDIRQMNKFMYDTYGIECLEAWTSKYNLRQLFALTKFRPLAALVSGGFPIIAGPNSDATIDPNYINPGWNEEAAIAIIERATGVKFNTYDGIFRTRPIGSNTFTNTRYMSSNKVIFKATDADLAEVDISGIGFARTLTSPHAEGNFQPGFYEWEQDRKDPWRTDRGSGIKAFPIFPFMKYSYVMKVRDPQADPTWSTAYTR